MAFHYLQPMVDKQEAVTRMRDHIQSNWWKKIRKSKRLVSMEPLYIPFWCFEYYAKTHKIPDGMEGIIAIEPISDIKAIMPTDYEVNVTENGKGFFPIQQGSSQEQGYNAIYWELFTKEKKREKIEVKVQNSWVLHMPYWIGYTLNRNQTYDILCVDRITGKVDLMIKDTALDYIRG